MPALLVAHASSVRVLGLPSPESASRKTKAARTSRERAAFCTPASKQAKGKYYVDHNASSSAEKQSGRALNRGRGFYRGTRSRQGFVAIYSGETQSVPADQIRMLPILRSLLQHAIESIRE